MRRTGQYKILNLVFGVLPLVGAILIRQMREDSAQAYLWLSIARPSSYASGILH